VYRHVPKLPDPTAQPLMNLQEVARVMRIGRTKAYQLAQANELPAPVIKVAGRYRVPTAALLEALHLTD
jgi:excisionase family DNA binding protein